MTMHHPSSTFLLLLLLLPFLLLLLRQSTSTLAPSDTSTILTLSTTLTSPSFTFPTTPDPCAWPKITCSGDRITVIQLGNFSLSGTLPSLSNLTSLLRLELQENLLSGPLPDLSGLKSLQVLLLHGNRFSSVPVGFFGGLSSLQAVSLDRNPFEKWTLPESLKDATNLVNFSANEVNLSGRVPEVFGGDNFPGLKTVALAFNDLEGEIPPGFAGSSIEVLWLNGQSGPLSGGIEVVGNMTELVQLWLHSNNFSGPIPDLGGLVNLRDLQLRDNRLTGPVPESVVGLKALKKVTLTNNLLQGPVPEFGSGVDVDMNVKDERFCLPGPGMCDGRVMDLIEVMRPLGYPVRFADSWKGNDPCAGWAGIGCDQNGNVTVINFKNAGLSGTISPGFGQFGSLQKLVLAGNNLTGSVPDSVTKLSNLKEVDLSLNSLSGEAPKFADSVRVNVSGNQFGKDLDPSGKGPSGGALSPRHSAGDKGGNRKSSSISAGVVVGSILGGLALLSMIGLGIFCFYKRKKNTFGRVQSPNTMVIHPRHSGSDPDLIKVTVASSAVNGFGASTEALSRDSSNLGDVRVGESGNMVISIQVLRNVTNNFSSDNILGQGGFGTVYRGELHDGTKIAVKRMESGVMGSKGLTEFQSEITVLTKVRHRHLVSLLGYCLDGNERLLVYEYMPQGTLSRHLFNWSEEGLRPLEWKKRLSIALDVARGVEYLHSLAHQSFIHRDLKPSNILLGDDMKAKVADFGLVRLAPDGKCSVETRLAGTFGYLAPEYAVTGRVTTKADVFSFGVILMEMITSRKALDERQPEESVHLVTWFRRMYLNKDIFPKAIDPTIDLDEETMASVNTIAELAGHCCAREPYQRPDMGHAVNVLSSLAEMWKPTDCDCEETYGIDLDLTLPQALKKWQAFEDSSRFDAGSSSFLASLNNTQTSIPTRPTGFADSFTSADGR